jgi:hypothetical protein
VWRSLERRAWQRLLDADLPVVADHLGANGYRAVVVNGRTVIDVLTATGLVDWTVDQRLDGPPPARLYVGSPSGLGRPGGAVAGTVFVGWSCNLQNQPGAAALATELAAWLQVVLGTSDVDVAGGNVPVCGAVAD